MKFMSMARKGIALAVLSLALVFPTGAFAATTSGTAVSETLTLASTISATFPAGPVTYANTSGDFWAGSLLHITGLTTNNVTGLKVTETASNMTSGTNTISALLRRAAASAVGGSSIVAAAAITTTYGKFLTPTTALVIGSSTVPLSGAQGLDVSMEIDMSNAIPGVYTGTLNFTAATNP